MRPTISLRGAWMWAWALWIVAFLGWLLWAPYFLSPETARLGLKALFTAFAPLEIAGAVDLRNDKGQEVAKTLSQFSQYVSQMAKPGSAWWQSWKALTTGFVVLISAAAGWAFSDLHVAFGAVVGATVFTWNLYHWLNRGGHG